MNRIAAVLLTLPVLSVGAAPTSPLKELTRIHIGGEPHWDYLTVDSLGHRLYVSHATQTEVIDTQSDKVIGSIPNTPGVHGIAIASDLGKGFISDGRANAVTVFDLKSMKPTGDIAVGANPDAILYDPASKVVMTFNGKSKDMTFIEAATGEVKATLAVGGKPEFAQMGADGLAWFNIEDTNEIAAVDPTTAKMVRRVSVAPCESPSGLAVDNQKRLYAVCENRLMVVVSTDAKLVAKASIGAGSDGVAWMDGVAWSANGQDGTVSAVETTSGKYETVATIATAAGARTIAADPATHRLYLPTADLQPAKVGERRQGVPGSFYVLVLEKAH